jgi:hypothetical protein
MHCVFNRMTSICFCDSKLGNYSYEFTCGLFEEQRMKTAVGFYGYNVMLNH